MVEIDKILSERSDERILKALQDLPDREFSGTHEPVRRFRIHCSSLFFPSAS